MSDHVPGTSGPADVERMKANEVHFRAQPLPDQGEPVAVLFSYDPTTGEHTADPVVGLHSSGMDPITWAFALKDSIEADFPERLWSVTGNASAQELRRQALITAVLG